MFILGVILGLIFPGSNAHRSLIFCSYAASWEWLYYGNFSSPPTLLQMDAESGVSKLNSFKLFGFDFANEQGECSREKVGGSWIYELYSDTVRDQIATNKNRKSNASIWKQRSTWSHLSFTYTVLPAQYITHIRSFQQPHIPPMRSITFPSTMSKLPIHTSWGIHLQVQCFRSYQPCTR